LRGDCAYSFPSAGKGFLKPFSLNRQTVEGLTSLASVATNRGIRIAPVVQWGPFTRPEYHITKWSIVIITSLIIAAGLILLGRMAHLKRFIRKNGQEGDVPGPPLP
jgi:hypothetical protein